MSTNRKPSGFWTKDGNVQGIMQKYAKNELTLDAAAGQLHDYVNSLGVTQTYKEVELDVVWYARITRKQLGIASVLEAKRSAVAQVELAQ